MLHSSFFHGLSAFLSIIAFLVCSYLLHINENKPLKVMIFVTIILFTTNVGLYYLSIQK